MRRVTRLAELYARARARECVYELCSSKMQSSTDSPLLFAPPVTTRAHAALVSGSEMNLFGNDDVMRTLDAMSNGHLTRIALTGTDTEPGIGPKTNALAPRLRTKHKPSSTMAVVAHPVAQPIVARGYAAQPMSFEHANEVSSVGMPLTASLQRAGRGGGKGREKRRAVRSSGVHSGVAAGVLLYTKMVPETSSELIGDRPLRNRCDDWLGLVASHNPRYIPTCKRPLSIPQRERVLIVLGPTGCGKTTLINVLLSHHSATLVPAHIDLTCDTTSVVRALDDALQTKRVDAKLTGSTKDTVVVIDDVDMLDELDSKLASRIASSIFGPLKLSRRAVFSAKRKVKGALKRATVRADVERQQESTSIVDEMLGIGNPPSMPSTKYATAPRKGRKKVTPITWTNPTILIGTSVPRALQPHSSMYSVVNLRAFSTYELRDMCNLAIQRCGAPHLMSIELRAELNELFPKCGGDLRYLYNQLDACGLRAYGVPDETLLSRVPERHRDPGSVSTTIKGVKGGLSASMRDVFFPLKKGLNELITFRAREAALSVVPATDACELDEVFYRNPREWLACIHDAYIQLYMLQRDKASASLSSTFVSEDEQLESLSSIADSLSDADMLESYSRKNPSHMDILDPYIARIGFARPVQSLRIYRTSTNARTPHIERASYSLFSSLNREVSDAHVASSLAPTRRRATSAPVASPSESTLETGSDAATRALALQLGDEPDVPATLSNSPPRVRSATTCVDHVNILLPTPCGAPRRANDPVYVSLADSHSATRVVSLSATPLRSDGGPTVKRVTRSEWLDIGQTLPPGAYGTCCNESRADDELETVDDGGKPARKRVKRAPLVNYAAFHHTRDSLEWCKAWHNRVPVAYEPITSAGPKRYGKGRGRGRGHGGGGRRGRGNGRGGRDGKKKSGWSRA